jgi:hypothetical protein
VLLRAVIAEVQPLLAARAFRLTERGVEGDCRWVEFARLADDSQRVAFLHVAALQRIGARYRWPNALGSPLPSRLAAQFWPCPPDALAASPRREALVGAMRAWVAAVLAASDPAPVASFA